MSALTDHLIKAAEAAIEKHLCVNVGWGRGKCLGCDWKGELYTSPAHIAEAVVTAQGTAIDSMLSLSIET